MNIVEPLKRSGSMPKDKTNQIKRLSNILQRYYKPWEADTIIGYFGIHVEIVVRFLHFFMVKLIINDDNNY